MEDLLACSRLATFGLRDVFLIGWMIGASFDRIAIGSAQSVIAALPPGSFRMKDWQALDDLWTAHAAEARADVVRAIDGERVLLGMWIFEQVMLRRISLDEEIAKRTNAASFEEAAVMHGMTKIYETTLIPLLVSDYATYLRLMLSVRGVLQDGRTGSSAEESFARSIPRWAIISRITAPTFYGIIELLEEYEVNLRLGRLGLELEDFRSRVGNYPAILQELGLPGSAITDPFTGQPFIYRTEGNNVLVYSVGFDRRNDDGVPRAGDRRRDIAWRITRTEVEP